MMKKIFVVITSFLVAAMVYAQPDVIYLNDDVIYTDEDQQIFNQYISYISNNTQTLKFYEVLEKTACFFIDKPYVAHTIETEGEEKVVINLREFDCTTYIETVVALTQTVLSKNHSFEKFTKELVKLRYRKGVVDGYSSRLHYFTDWLYDNEKKGALKNITSRLGGPTEEKNINYMSTHRNAYRQLEFNDSNLSEIENIENEISKRGGIAYIPKSKIVDIESKIPHLSIISFTTSIEGLDVTHTAFAYQKDGKLTFIHASSAKNKVVIDANTINEYCKLHKSCTGIIVAKLL